MLKPMLAALALLSTTACMDLDSGPQVTRDYTGSFVGCPGLTAVSAQYSQSVAGLPVRCGPQVEAPVTYR